ncbi:MAG TPA: zinc ribbon domain-containing protein, partial [Desulfobacteraceae bacterium]|nr:zinc ribbon domain-containing protein [Desulfobacteraceae bacterium]
TERLTEGQKFCHNCGNPLIGQSAFEACLKLKIEDLPIPKWQKEAIIKETQIRIVEDILISQGPASELKKAHGIGKVKSNKIYEIVNKVHKNIYEEFLA